MAASSVPITVSKRTLFRALPASSSGKEVDAKRVQLFDQYQASYNSYSRSCKHSLIISTLLSTSLLALGLFLIITNNHNRGFFYFAGLSATGLAPAALLAMLAIALIRSDQFYNSVSKESQRSAGELPILQERVPLLAFLKQQTIEDRAAFLKGLDRMDAQKMKLLKAELLSSPDGIGETLASVLTDYYINHGLTKAERLEFLKLFTSFPQSLSINALLRTIPLHEIPLSVWTDFPERMALRVNDRMSSPGHTVDDIALFKPYIGAILQKLNPASRNAMIGAMTQEDEFSRAVYRETLHCYRDFFAVKPLKGFNQKDIDIFSEKCPADIMAEAMCAVWPEAVPGPSPSSNARYFAGGLGATLQRQASGLHRRVSEWAPSVISPPSTPLKSLPPLNPVQLQILSFGSTFLAKFNLEKGVLLLNFCNREKPQLMRSFFEYHMSRVIVEEESDKISSNSSMVMAFADHPSIVIEGVKTMKDNTGKLYFDEDVDSTNMQQRYRLLAMIYKQMTDKQPFDRAFAETRLLALVKAYQRELT